MKSGEPFTLWRGQVGPEWIDANGHMGEGWYGLVFAMATDEYLLRLPTDGGAFYTVETHIGFLAETTANAELEVLTWVAGADELQLHLFHELWAGGEPALVATQEALLLHVDAASDRVGPAHDAVVVTARGDAAAQAETLDRTQLGAAISPVV